MPQVRLSVDGAPDTGVALWQWLRAEPELRGQVSREQVPTEAGAMGGATELVVALASTGTLAAVARTVGVWLTHRHGDVTVTLPDGKTLATTSSDKTARIWATATGQPPVSPSTAPRLTPSGVPSP